jgi:hypothetical protein
MPGTWVPWVLNAVLRQKMAMLFNELFGQEGFAALHFTTERREGGGFG